MSHDRIPRLDASFEALGRLRNGRRVRLRFIRPTDTALIRAGFAGLSEETRRMRFFLPIRELSDETIRHMTDVDGRNHVAVVALSVPYLAPGGSERGLGVARFVRSQEDATRAELAITVTDDAQRLGLGRLLLSTVAAAARERGIETFTMDVLSSNTRVRETLRKLHAAFESREGDVVRYSLKTSAVAAAEPHSSRPFAA